MITNNECSHISKDFDMEIGKINKNINDSMDIVLDEIELIINYIQADIDINNDSYLHDIITAKNQKINNNILTTIALRSPVANDLKELLLLSKISYELLRISHYCQVSKRRALRISKNILNTSKDKIISMLGVVIENMKNLSNIEVDDNKNDIVRIMQFEEQINKKHNDIIQDIILNMSDNAKKSSMEYVELILLIKGLEKIGDHITAIAKLIINNNI